MHARRRLRNPTLADVEHMNREYIGRVSAEVIECSKKIRFPLSGLDAFITQLGARADVLDLGCGTGRVAPWFMERGKRYTGIDFLESFLAEARRVAPGASFVCASFTALPFPPASFDGVFACCSLQYTPKLHMPQLLRGVHQVLRAHGAFVVMLPYLGVEYEEVEEFDDGSAIHRAWWDVSEFKAELETAGFSVHDAFWVDTEGSSYFVATRR